MRCPVLALRALRYYWASVWRYLHTRVYGTDIAYGAICIRACYEMTGTDIVYGALGTHACYAMSGTDIAYAGPDHRGIRGRHPLWCYALAI
eukprot:3545038-Rhodomonas_salina.5